MTDKQLTKKLSKRIKQELRLMKKRKKECAQLYPDWRDDEYNMLENRFIWGISAKENEKASFITYNKAVCYYNRRTQKYYLDIDTSFFDDDAESLSRELNYLIEITNAFQEYVYRGSEATPLRHIPFSEWSIEPVLEADTLERLCCKLRQIVLLYNNYITHKAS